MSDSSQSHGMQHIRFLCPPVSPSLLKFMSIYLMMLSNHLIFFHSLLFLPSIFPSRVFSNESALHIRWQNYWSFIFTKSPSSEYSELISFRIDSFDLLAVQGTFKSLLQHHSSKTFLRNRKQMRIKQKVDSGLIS